KAEAISKALAGLGNNVRMVNFGGNGHSNGNGSGNSYMDFLLGIPEMAEVLRSKVEALSGDDIQSTAMRIAQMFDAIKTVRGMNDEPAAVVVPPVVTPESPITPATPPVQ